MPAGAEFRPTLWSSNIITNTDKAFVFANLVNRDYEGEITGRGQIVKINEIGDITVNNYTEDTDITFQTLTGASRDLVIDQAKYFAFGVDDVLRAQADAGLISSASAKAGFAIADTVDSFIAAKYADAGITTSGLGTSGSSLSLYASHSSGNSNLLGFFSRVNRYMDEANVPSMGRWIVIPPWLHSYMVYANLANDAPQGGIQGDPGAFGNGFVRNLTNLDIYASNNVDNNGSTQWRVMFGTRDAISFAGQVTMVESGRKEKQFGGYVKGLYVYGAKVVRPDRLGVAYVDDAGLTT